MRIAICCMSIWATTVLVGCGQTGALQLPSDPNYDKRAQYLLYENSQAKNQAEQAERNKVDTVIDQPAASDITE